MSYHRPLSISAMTFSRSAGDGFSISISPFRAIGRLLMLPLGLGPIAGGARSCRCHRFWFGPSGPAGSHLDILDTVNFDRIDTRLGHSDESRLDIDPDPLPGHLLRHRWHGAAPTERVQHCIANERVEPQQSSHEQLWKWRGVIVTLHLLWVYGPDLLREVAVLLHRGGALIWKADARFFHLLGNFPRPSRLAINDDHFCGVVDQVVARKRIRSEHHVARLLLPDNHVEESEVGAATDPAIVIERQRQDSSYRRLVLLRMRKRHQHRVQAKQTAGL